VKDPRTSAPSSEEAFVSRENLIIIYIVFSLHDYIYSVLSSIPLYTLAALSPGTLYYIPVLTLLVWFLARCLAHSFTPDRTSHQIKPTGTEKDTPPNHHK